MHEERRRRLEARGWKVGTASEFLALSPEEAAYVELKVRLALGLRAWRQRGEPDAGTACEAAPVEPITDREDGGGRPVGISGSPRQIAPDAGGFAT